jgi:ATP-binding cassette subfamily B protein
MIAHRLTSIVSAKNILVLDKGQIVEKGSHKTLIEKQGIYSGMWSEYQKSVTWTI